MPKTDRKTVLVVDDDRDLLSLIRFVLEQEGYQVETAAHGRDALRAVERGMPDLILLDMKMPVMDGWGFCAEFHARYGSQVPIVVLTASEDARKAAEQVGASGWVGKPFDLDDLLNTIEHLIGSE